MKMDIVFLKNTHEIDQKMTSLIIFKHYFFYTKFIFIVLRKIHSKSCMLLQELTLMLTFQVCKCGYVMILMATYWTTEALPLPITSLIPIVFLPFFGIHMQCYNCAQ